MYINGVLVQWWHCEYVADVSPVARENFFLNNFWSTVRDLMLAGF